MKKDVLNILKEVKIVTVGTIDSDGNPWICNVHFGVDENLNLYFVSKEDSNHSKHISEKKEVAFTVYTFNKTGKNDKASVQGKGLAEPLYDLQSISVGAKTISEKFSKWIIDPQDMVSNPEKKRMYKISPTYIKYLDSIVLGDERTEEFISF